MSGILRKYARYADTLYYLSFSLFTIFMTLSNSMLGQSGFFHGLLLAVKFLCLGLVCGKILLSGDFLKKSFLPAMLFMMLSVIVYLVMGDSLLMMLTFLTFGAYGCSHKRLARLFLWCAGSVVLLCTLCATLGIVEDRIFYRHDSNTARHSMGMTYATIWSAMIFFLSAVYLYLRKKNIRLWELLLAALVSIGAYLLSQTRIELAASLVMVAAVLLFRYYRKAKITPWILSYSVIIACAVAFITVYLYIWDPEACAFLNRLLTGRLWYGSQGITQYGYSLFGQVIPMQGHGTIQSDPKIGYFFIDAFYINFTLQYGAVFMIGFVAYFTGILLNLSRRGYTWLLVFIFLAAMHGVIISDIFNPAMCPFFVLAYAAYTSRCPDTRWAWIAQTPLTRLWPLPGAHEE